MKLRVSVWVDVQERSVNKRQMTKKRRRPSNNIMIAVLLTALLAILWTLGVGSDFSSGARAIGKDAAEPLRFGFDDVTGPIGRFLGRGTHYAAIVKQNSKLMNELNQLKYQERTQEDIEQSYQALELLLGANPTPSLQRVIAQVINITTTDLSATLQISVGKDSGVLPGMAVTAATGLVGQVTNASQSTATVRLITDGGSSVGVRYGPGNDLAVANGQGAYKTLSADLIPPNTPLTNQTVFVTSGLQGSPFPGNIPVATLANVHTGISTTQESVTLQPLVQVNDLRYVAVVLSFGT